MATKLKNLKIKKVDFVDEGANPDARIRMLKRKDMEGREAEEDGKKSSGGLLKKMFGFIGKAAGMDQSEIDSALDEVRKSGSVSFHESFNEVWNRKAADEIWDACYALHASLCSALNDGDLDSKGKAAAMQESLGEFYSVMQDSFTAWAAGREAGIARTEGEAPMEPDKKRKTNQKEDMEGDGKEMKIDKSKLTAAERAFLESIEKRCGIGEDAGSDNEGHTEGAAFTEPMCGSFGPEIKKSVWAMGTFTQPEGEPDHIYKNLHPAVKAELEELKKFREAVEDKELTEAAGKYAVIGKKAEELAPLFKSLKAAGGSAYGDMIAILDQAVETVEKSGVFSEIGKSGHGGAADGGAWAEAEAKAVELMKSKAGISKAQALDEVLAENPELAERCEKEE